MGKGYASIGISAAVTALSFGLAAPIAAIGFLGNAAIGLGLGAAMGGLGLLVGNKTPKTKREIQDINITSSIRNAPVPVLFGRGRVAGNYIILGNFFRAGTNRKDFGARVYIIHAIIGICEGPLKWVGNLRIDGKTITQLSEETYKTDASNLSVELITDGGVSGTPTELVPGAITETLSDVTKTFYPTITRPVPWRNTAKWDLQTIVGASPTLVSINGDAVGPDYTYRRSGAATGTDQGNDLYNTSGSAFYDAYTESIYFIPNGAGTLSTPLGLARVHRNDSAGYAHTQPPTAVSSAISKAWYFGKHDVLVMQDPSENALFHIGYWGISRSSTDWEYVRPHPDYSVEIDAMHVDELHGIVHTLHEGASNTYILRWNLLTGRVEKMVIDALDGTATAMVYSSDFHSYIITDDGGTLRMVDAETGGTTHTNASLNLTSIRALCTSGNRIGIIKVSSFLYYDPADSSVSGVYGSSSTDITVEGALGGLKASAQNSLTGQVLLGRYSAGDTNAEWNLFIPSVVEDLEDISANGSPKEHEFQWDLEESDCAPILNQSDATDWVRDWSWRKYASFSQVSLEGNSSLAAALYASIVDYLSADAAMVDTDDVPLDTARWGAGIDASHVDLPSFEALHAYCVGGVKYQNKLRVFNCDPEYIAPDSSSTQMSSGATAEDAAMVERWAERCKFDYLLDSETSAASLALDTILPCCNGYLFFEDGKLHAGFNRTGAFPIWHFTNDQIDDQNPISLQFNDRLGGLNRIRAQFLEVRDEYRINLPAEWNDEWNQNAIGRVRAQTLTLSGCGRHGQAELIAKLTGDQTVATRQSGSFGTHFLGNVISPGDVIEVTDPGTGLDRKKFKIMSVGENEDSTFQFEIQEWNPITQVLRDNPVTSPPDNGPQDECVGCGDEFEWDTGVLSEHNMGGTEVFIHSSEVFTVCSLVHSAVVFDGTSDDFVLLTAAGDAPTQEYSGVRGDPVTITFPANYILFRNSSGSLRADATVAKTITDGTNSSSIPAASGTAYDQVSDLIDDGFEMRQWADAVTFAEMLANGWVDADGVAHLQFHHVVCGNGFGKVDGFVCVDTLDFTAYDTGEETAAGTGCDDDVRWWQSDPTGLSDVDLVPIRAKIVADAILSNGSGDTPPGPGGWPDPLAPDTHWIATICSGQFYGSVSPPESGTDDFYTRITIGASVDLDVIEFPFQMYADDTVTDVYINGVLQTEAITYDGTPIGYSAPAKMCRFRKDLHPDLATGLNTIRFRVQSSYYARGMHLIWFAPNEITPARAAAPMQSPIDFTFTDVTGATTSAVTTSDPIVIGGNENAVWPMTVRGAASPQISIDNTNWFTDLLVRTGDSLYVRQTASGSAATAVTATIYAANYSTVWTVTTA